MIPLDDQENEAGPSSLRQQMTLDNGSSSIVMDDTESQMYCKCGVERIEMEAGPSRPLRLRGGSSHPPPTSTTETAPATSAPSHSTPPQPPQSNPRRYDRPASPETALHSGTSSDTSPNHPSRTETPSPHLDLATYPTPTLLRLLASLLQQIATANDALRPTPESRASSEVRSATEEIDGDGQEDGTRDRSSSSRRSSRAGSTSRQTPVPGQGPSSTTALFKDTEKSPSVTSSRAMTSDHSSDGNEPSTSQPPPKPDPNLTVSVASQDIPLFTASRISLAHPSSLLSFHARHIPSISIEAYLLRILKYCPTTNEVFLGLLVYFDRMSRLGTSLGVGGGGAATRGARGFAIDSFNVHRLVIAGVTVASKFFSDVFYTNSRYAKVGGLPSHELNQLELQFLLLNDFRLVIPPEEMQRYGDRLLGYWEGREAEIGIDVISGRALSDRGRSTRRGNSPKKQEEQQQRTKQPPQDNSSGVREQQSGSQLSEGVNGSSSATTTTTIPATEDNKKIDSSDKMDVDSPATTATSAVPTSTEPVTSTTESDEPMQVDSKSPTQHTQPPLRKPSLQTDSTKPFPASQPRSTTDNHTPTRTRARSASVLDGAYSHHVADGISNGMAWTRSDDPVTVSGTG